MATLSPLALFDIASDGAASSVADAWPAATGNAGYRWVHLDLNQPDTQKWCDEHLPQVASHALNQSETRPRLSELDGGLILTVRGVNLNANSDPEDMVSLRLYITPSSITSTRLRKVFAVDDIRQRAEAGRGPRDVGSFLVSLMRGLTERVEDLTLKLEDRTDEAEEQALSGKEVPDIAELRQQVIKLKRYIGPQKEAFFALAAQDTVPMDGRTGHLLHEIANRAARNAEVLDSLYERLVALQDHTDAHTARRLAQNSYIFSIMATVFLPLGFLTGLFGVNVGGMPGTDSAMGFALLTLGLVILGVLLVILFRLAKWF